MRYQISQCAFSSLVSADWSDMNWFLFPSALILQNLLEFWAHRSLWNEFTFGKLLNRSPPMHGVHKRNLAISRRFHRWLDCLATISSTNGTSLQWLDDCWLVFFSGGNLPACFWTGKSSNVKVFSFFVALSFIVKSLPLCRLLPGSPDLSTIALEASRSTSAQEKVTSRPWHIKYQPAMSLKQLKLDWTLSSGIPAKCTVWFFRSCIVKQYARQAYSL